MYAMTNERYRSLSNADKLPDGLPIMRRSRSLSELPGHLRVPILQRKDTERTRARLEAGAAGVKELRALRDQQQELIDQAMATAQPKWKQQTLQRPAHTQNDHHRVHHKVEHQRQQMNSSFSSPLSTWHSACSLASISEERDHTLNISANKNTLGSSVNDHKKTKITLLRNAYYKQNDCVQSQNFYRGRSQSVHGDFFYSPDAQGNECEQMGSSPSSLQCSGNKTSQDYGVSLRRDVRITDMKSKANRSDAYTNTHTNIKEREQKGDQILPLRPNFKVRSQSMSWDNLLAVIGLQSDNNATTNESMEQDSEKCDDVFTDDETVSPANANYPASPDDEYFQTAQIKKMRSQSFTSGCSTSPHSAYRLLSSKGPPRGNHSRNGHVSSTGTIMDENVQSDTAQGHFCEVKGQTSDKLHSVSLLRRASIQCEAVLTQTSTPRKIMNPLQDVDINSLRSPGPLHAVTLQYSSMPMKELSASRPNIAASSDSVSRLNIAASSDSASRPNIAASSDSVSRPNIAVSSDSVSRPNIAASSDSVSRPNIAASSDSVSRPNIAASSDSVSRPNIAASSDSVSRPNIAASSDSVSRPNIAASSDSVSRPNIAASSDVVPGDKSTPSNTPALDAEVLRSSASTEALRRHNSISERDYKSESVSRSKQLKPENSSIAFPESSLSEVIIKTTSNEQPMPTPRKSIPKGLPPHEGKSQVNSCLVTNARTKQNMAPGMLQKSTLHETNRSNPIASDRSNETKSFTLPCFHHLPCNSMVEAEQYRSKQESVNKNIDTVTVYARENQIAQKVLSVHGDCSSVKKTTPDCKVNSDMRRNVPMNKSVSSTVADQNPITLKNVNSLTGRSQIQSSSEKKNNQRDCYKMFCPPKRQLFHTRDVSILSDEGYSTCDSTSSPQSQLSSVGSLQSCNMSSHSCSSVANITEGRNYSSETPKSSVQKQCMSSAIESYVKHERNVKNSPNHSTKESTRTKGLPGTNKGTRDNPQTCREQCNTLEPKLCQNPEVTTAALYHRYHSQGELAQKTERSNHDASATDHLQMCNSNMKTSIGDTVAKTDKWPEIVEGVMPMLTQSDNPTEGAHTKMFKQTSV